MPDNTYASDLLILSRHLVLREIRYNELRAKAEGVSDDELIPPAFRLGVTIAEESPQDDPSILLASAALNVELAVPEGRISVEPVAVYHIPIEHAKALNPVALTAYINETGIFEILPFARQALSDLSGKVFQNQILMPLFREGDVRFDLPTAEEILRTDEGDI